jgi:hypothetical protein
MFKLKLGGICSNKETFVYQSVFAQVSFAVVASDKRENCIKNVRNQDAEDYSTCQACAI